MAGTAAPPENQTLADMLSALSRVGRRLDSIGAVEASAGNVSVAMSWSVNLDEMFPVREPIELPVYVPQLAGYTILVTGSGCQVHRLADDPLSVLGAIVVNTDGRTGILHRREPSDFRRPTVEFNSHLAVHAERVATTGAPFHCVIHAQPPYVAFLTHIPAYQSTATLTAALMRWEAETIAHLPEGVGYVKFHVPGTSALMAANVEGLRRHRLVAWAKHGVMARSDVSPIDACDLVEYVEAAARFEYLNLACGSPAEGLSATDLNDVATTLGLPPVDLADVEEQ